jgi:hypothetical protein
MLSSSPPSPPSSFGLSAESSAPVPSPSPTIDTPLSSHPSITITSHEPLQSTILSYKADPAFAGSSLVHFVDESDDLENARACLAEWGKKNKGRTVRVPSSEGENRAGRGMGKLIGDTRGLGFV